MLGMPIDAHAAGHLQLTFKQSKARVRTTRSLAY
jgi:hypothetical protein